MPAANLDIKSIKTFIAGLKDKLDELGRHL
jgi:hypothetical protein